MIPHDGLVEAPRPQRPALFPHSPPPPLVFSLLLIKNAFRLSSLFLSDMLIPSGATLSAWLPIYRISGCVYREYPPLHAQKGETRQSPDVEQRNRQRYTESKTTRGDDSLIASHRFFLSSISQYFPTCIKKLVLRIVTINVMHHSFTRGRVYIWSTILLA